MSTKMFNVRVEDDLAAAIDDAAQKVGVTRSVWAREVLAAAAYGLISLNDVRSDGSTPQVHPERFLTLQAAEIARRTPTGECQHPVQALKQLPFTDVCGVCGLTLRQR